jgi:hypothetical protein
MRARYLAIAAAVWTLGFAVVYVILIRAQGSAPVWWVVAALAAVVAMLVLAAAGRWAKPMLITASVLLAGLTIAGSPSIGLLLVPAVVAAIVAAVRVASTPHPPRSGAPAS